MVVFDIGSHCFKAGFAAGFPSDEEPRVMRAPSVEVLTDPASSSSGTLRTVVDRGEIKDFDGLESIIHHSLYDALGWPLGGEGGNVVLSEAMLTSRAERERLTQLMFEVGTCIGSRRRMRLSHGHISNSACPPQRVLASMMCTLVLFRV